MTRAQDHGPASRAAAARAVAAVAAGVSLGEALDSALRTTAAADRGLASELAYGTLRFHPRLALMAERLLSRPLPADAADLHALLLVGLYQLEELQTPAHVAVTNTVEAARVLGRGWATALVNAILRNSQRQREALQAAIAASEPARHAHPQWLIDAIRHAHPADWPAILAANNQRPPMTLRVNGRHESRDAYLQRLGAAGIDATPGRHAAEALTLSRPLAVEALPGFADGWVSVQDEAAQLATGLLDVSPGMQVLDACAAPGGKCAHLLEREPALARVVAVDEAPARVQRLQQTLARLRLAAEVVLGDATDPGSWWDGQAFDRILLDAPCSATGVIRRHPDIKSLRSERDLAALAHRQRQLLEALWPLLRRGGKLLYVTCSVLPQENAEVVEQFVQARGEAGTIGIDAAWGRAVGPGRQILPGDNGMDGFFYALLGKD